MKKLALLLAVIMVICSFGAVTVFAAGTGVEGDPYLITTPEELLAMSENNSAHYKLANNIDLTGYTWTPFDFNGYLDGDHKEITNITLDTTSGNVGMFTYLRGTVENLIIKSGSMTTTGNNIGSIAGEAQNGAVIRNCVNYATITGNQNVGGFAGITNNATIENCTNYGAIVSNHGNQSYAAGIVAYCWDTTVITDCVNFGDLSGSSYVAGIVANLRQNVTISGCTNNGDITATAGNNGGIAASLPETCSIDGCINNGDVNAAATNNGGIVTVINGSVTNCKNYGDISQTQWTIGGIAAAFSKGTLKDCENHGTITGGQNGTGGIVGLVNGSDNVVDNCDNYGEVKGNYQYTGGIVGELQGNKVINCENTGAVSGNRINGGIAGFANQTTIENCSNSGSIICSGGGAVGGIAGQATGNETVKTTITNCTNTGDILGAELSFKQIGGIAGDAAYTTIDSCTNDGTVSSANEKVGGIVGHAGAGATLINVVNNKAIIGGNITGGIAGHASSADTVITKATNNGSITAANQVGGIAGSSSASLTQLCANTGIITATGGNRGGIFGQFVGTGVITDCYSISDSKNIGGFVGAIETVGATITNSYAMGTGSNAMYNWKKGALADSSNVFYLGTYNNANEAVAKTSDEFADGTVVALLNGDRTGADAVWEQGESYPVFKTASSDDEEPVVTAAEITSITDTTVAYAVTLADEDATAIVIIALYNGDQLFAVKTVSADEVSADFTTTVGATNAKIFVWENLVSLKPIVMDEYGF